MVMVLEEASTVSPPETTGTSAKEDTPSSKHSSQPELDHLTVNGQEDVKEVMLLLLCMRNNMLKQSAISMTTAPDRGDSCLVRLPTSH